MKIHTAYSYPHYGDHLKAIHKHLPDEIRGENRCTRLRLKDIPDDDIIMVAGYSDLALAGNRRVVFVEHGAGQRYVGLDPRVQHFYGGPYPSNVIAYLGPRQDVVERVGLPGVAIGAPICDPYELYGEEGVCAITFHWKAGRICPEADSALNHYARHLGAIVSTLRECGWEVLGHRHPKLRGSHNLWSALDVEEVDVETVRKRASLLLADNTSLAYEMAYLLRQNISLNAPWYRRDVEHGLRFWADPPGIQVDDAEELVDVISRIENHLPRAWSTRAALAAYGEMMSTGSDGLRAAAWMVANLAL